MQTIKTGVVVALLLAVCYGAFVALNAPEPDLPEELLSEFNWNPDEADLDGLMDIEMPTGQSLTALPSPASTMAGLPEVGPTASESGGFTLPTLPSLSSASPAATGTSLAPPLPTLEGPPASNTTTSTSLPAFPAVGGTPVAAADGPAVALSAAPPAAAEASGAPAAAAESTKVALPTAVAGGPPTGQLVSQSRPVSTAADGAVQLPLLNPAEAGEASASPPAAKAPPTQPFETARQQALDLASKDKLHDALKLLSAYYHSPELTSEQHGDLVDILDALSREVIYSPRHLVEAPHTVAAGDTVESLAAKCQVTAELFTAINRLGDSKAVVDGSQVKMLSGPFRAEVSLSRQELTLFLGDLYAGRFPVSFGGDPSPVAGTFEVVDRRRDRTYYGTGGKVIAAGDPRNPYGGYWLNLGQDLCIHGTEETSSDDLQNAGCISLAPLDAADVYNILSQSSQVSIVR